jgi:hypothetical protein
MAHADSDVSIWQFLGLAKESARRHLRRAVLQLGFAGRIRWFLLPLLTLAALSSGAVPLRADTITGAVKDPSGALVGGAQVEITGGALTQALVITTDSDGKFRAANLSAGKYSLRISKKGFEDHVVSVELKGVAELSVNLVIATQQMTVKVTGKAAAFANSDSVYRQLRGLALGHTYHCENLTCRWTWGHSS